MRGRTAYFVLAMSVTTAAFVWAHDGHAHIVMGTVASVDAKRLGVKTPSGEILAIAITEKTLVLRDKRKAALREVQVGRRVVVDIGNGEDPLVAREIQVGAAAKGSHAATTVH